MGQPIAQALTQAFYDALLSDEALVAKLGVTALSDGQAVPNVFTMDPIPERARPPYVQTVGLVVVDPDDTKDRERVLVSRDVHAFTPANGDVSLVEDLGDRIRVLFHRRAPALKVDGWQVVAVETFGPIRNDLDDRYGRTVTVTALLQEV